MYRIYFLVCFFAGVDQLNVGDYISLWMESIDKFRHDEIISLLKNVGERVRPGGRVRATACLWVRLENCVLLIITQLEYFDSDGPSNHSASKFV